ncbi:UNVERIFIED_CONTAM: hypothetical protein FKN15_071138 [Acipenser sinensis]
MEAQGKQGDLVLVSGLRSGPARLRVQIDEPGYKTGGPGEAGGSGAGVGPEERPCQAEGSNRRARLQALSVHPGEHWVLETGRHYEVTVQVYDITGNRIHMSDVSMSLKKYFQVKKAAE